MKFLRDNQISSTILRVLFGNSSEKVPFSEADPKVIRTTPEKKLKKYIRNCKNIKANHFFDK